MSVVVVVALIDLKWNGMGPLRIVAQECKILEPLSSFLRRRTKACPVLEHL